MASPVRTAIILAVGRGTRLGAAITGDAPKSLVPIGGRSLLEHHTAAFAEVGVDHIVVVVGHASEQLVEAAGRLVTRYPVRFTFVPNPAYADTNTVVSQYLARAWIAEGCFCVNGDVLFGAGLLRRLVHARAGAALAVEVKPCGEEEVKVVVRDGRVVEIGKRLDPARTLGEFVGVARYNREAGAAFARALARAVEVERRRLDFFEVALDALAATVPLHAIATDGEPVVEIDTPDDYRRAIAEIAPRLEVA